MKKPEATTKGWWASVVSWAEAEATFRHEDKVLLVLTLIIGAIVGLVVVAFIVVTENLGDRLYPQGARRGGGWRCLWRARSSPGFCSAGTSPTRVAAASPKPRPRSSSVTA